MDRARAVQEACAALTEHGVPDAAIAITRNYPFTPIAPVKRAFREQDAIAVFVRDGFVDRYTGQRLVFPGVLRLLSHVLPKEFPFHPNWKTQVTHPAYWELFPTIDHVVPVSRGGPDESSNWVTTSMLKNGAKGNWLLEDLGWRLHPPGDIESWDGLLGWFVRYSRRNPDSLRSQYLQRWHRAAMTAGRKR